MTDTTITTPAQNVTELTTGRHAEFAPLTFTVAPGSNVEQHPAIAWELAHAENRTRLAEARSAELAARLEVALSEQIVNGDDPRLARFWEKAGRIADHADFCEEYDRMAEAMDGPSRERDYDVTMEVTLTVNVSRSLSARDGETAEDDAREGLDADDILSALRDNGIEEWEVRDVSVQRA